MKKQFYFKAFLFTTFKIFSRWNKKLATDYVYTDFTGSRRMHTPNSITCDDLVDDLDELKKDMGTFLLRFSDEDSIAYIGKLN